MASGALAHSDCRNCGSKLTGPYCSTCGQHAHESARSISALFHDAWHIATHVDDRFWQTLFTLLLRPGRLTQEYFAEHRARYLPPVRVYLVLSVLFFAFGAIAPQKMSRTLPTLSVTENHTDEPGSAKPKLNVNVVGEDDENTDSAKKKRGGFIFNVSDCDKVQTSIAWLKNPLHEACLRNISTGGAAVKTAFIANIPKMMFVFVPLMALTMLLLYWRPRRYYVEHLVFFLHNHAAIFLILLLEALLSWFALLLAWRTFRAWVVAVTTLYAIWYIYRAMRVYYGQGRLLTVTKLMVVGFAYLVGFSITLLATLIVSVLIA
jgi:Protein of unknown function (DUF3667)